MKRELTEKQKSTAWAIAKQRHFRNIYITYQSIELLNCTFEEKLALYQLSRKKFHRATFLEMEKACYPFLDAGLLDRTLARLRKRNWIKYWDDGNCKIVESKVRRAMRRTARHLLGWKENGHIAKQKKSSGRIHYQNLDREYHRVMNA